MMFEPQNHTNVVICHKQLIFSTESRSENGVCWFLYLYIYIYIYIYILNALSIFFTTVVWLWSSSKHLWKICRLLVWKRLLKHISFCYSSLLGNIIMKFLVKTCRNNSTQSAELATLARYQNFQSSKTSWEKKQEIFCHMALSIWEWEYPRHTLLTQTRAFGLNNNSIPQEINKFSYMAWS